MSNSDYDDLDSDNAQRVSITEFSNNSREYIRKAYHCDHRFIVTRYGEDFAALVPSNDYWRLDELDDIEFRKHHYKQVDKTMDEKITKELQELTARLDGLEKLFLQHIGQHTIQDHKTITIPVSDFNVIRDLAQKVGGIKQNKKVMDAS